MHQNTKKILIVMMKGFSRKLLSDSILDFGMCPNWKCMKVKVHVIMSFLVGTLPIIMFLERFGPYIKKFKYGFYIVFLKSDLGGGRMFFRQNCCLIKPNTQEYA